MVNFELLPASHFHLCYVISALDHSTDTRLSRTDVIMEISWMMRTANAGAQMAPFADWSKEKVLRGMRIKAELMHFQSGGLDQLGGELFEDTDRKQSLINITTHISNQSSRPPILIYFHQFPTIFLYQQEQAQGCFIINPVLIMLCTSCREIFNGHFDQRRYTHHLHVHDLEHAASRKCQICRVLWNVVSEHPQQSELPVGSKKPNLDPISRYTIRPASVAGKSILELGFTVDKNGTDQGGLAIDFCLQSIDGKN